MATFTDADKQKVFEALISLDRARLDAVLEEIGVTANNQTEILGIIASMPEDQRAAVYNAVEEPSLGITGPARWMVQAATTQAGAFTEAAIEKGRELITRATTPAPTTTSEPQQVAMDTPPLPRLRPDRTAPGVADEYQRQQAAIDSAAPSIEGMPGAEGVLAQARDLSLGYAQETLGLSGGSRSVSSSDVMNLYAGEYEDGLRDAGHDERTIQIALADLRGNTRFQEQAALDAFYIEQAMNAPMPRVAVEADPDMSITPAASVARAKSGIAASAPDLRDRTLTAYSRGLATGEIAPAEIASMRAERSKAMVNAMAEPSRTLDVREGANFGGVDPRLQDILQTAAASFPLQVEAFSGRKGRSSGTQNHPTGKAVDVWIYGEDGKPLPNSPAAAKRMGVSFEPAFRTYEAWAQTVRDVQEQKYPELTNDLRWGGYFRQGVSFDLMHIDISGGGMAYGTWANGMNAEGRRALPRAVSFGMADPRNDRMPVTALAFAPVTTPAMNTDRTMLSLARYGYTGPDAVRDFQRDMKGVAGPVDGIMGPQTLRGLERASFMPDMVTRQRLVAQGVPKGQVNSVLSQVKEKSTSDISGVLAAVGGGDALRKGDRSDDVRQLQHFLNAQGATDNRGRSLEEDGIFGARTKAALSSYQASTGRLVPDGVVGPRTAAMMERTNSIVSEAQTQTAALMPGGIPAPSVPAYLKSIEGAAYAKGLSIGGGDALAQADASSRYADAQLAQHDRFDVAFAPGVIAEDSRTLGGTMDGYFAARSGDSPSVVYRNKPMVQRASYSPGGGDLSSGPAYVAPGSTFRSFDYAQAGGFPDDGYSPDFAGGSGPTNMYDAGSIYDNGSFDSDNYDELWSQPAITYDPADPSTVDAWNSYDPQPSGPQGGFDIPDYETNPSWPDEPTVEWDLGYGIDGVGGW